MSDCEASPIGRLLFVAFAAIVGAQLSAGAFVLLTGAAFFQPQAYSEANDWIGLSLIGGLEAVLPAFLGVFALAAGLSDGRRTFGFMAAGIAASFVLVAALVFSWRPTPRSLRADDQVFLVGVGCWPLSRWCGLGVRWRGGGSNRDEIQFPTLCR